MKTDWREWKKGCAIAGRYIWFSCVLGFMCSPLTILVYLFPKLADQPVAEHGMHWTPNIIYLLLWIAWFPVACLLTAEFTQEFGLKETNTDGKQAEPPTSPYSDPASRNPQG